jgi:hypothetical protein
MLNPIAAGVPAPFDGLVKLMLKPIKKQIQTAIKDSLKDALTGSLDRIATSVSTAISSGLQGTEAQIKAQIHSILDPQIVRVVATLNSMVRKIEARITPLFNRIQSLIKIDVGPNFTTLEDVDVEVTAIGISNATAFVGMPPAGGFDWNQSIADQNAIGLFIEDLNLALGIFEPVAGRPLPNFTAAKITAGAAGFIDGDADVFTLTAEGITVELNLGGPVIPGAGNGTIDFVESFPEDADGTPPAGYAVQTGTTTEPIYLDFQGERILASVELANIQISVFFVIGWCIDLVYFMV